MSDATQVPLVSVIIPCRNHTRELEACLRSLARQDLDAPFETLVVDSAGDPQLRDVVARFPGARSVGSDAALGAGAARNFGAQHAAGSILAFVDADCEPEPGWLSALVAGLKAGGRLVGGPVNNARPFQVIMVADNLLQFADSAPGRPDERADHFPSCNMAIARADFQQIGGFPVIRFSACEDVMFCETAKAAWPEGMRFVNGMRVKHLGRGRLMQYWRHQEQFGYCRAALNLRLRNEHRRLGRYAIMMVPVVLKRLSYILGRAARWNRPGLLYAICLLPLLLFGLAGWAVGFRRGCVGAPETGR